MKIHSNLSGSVTDPLSTKLAKTTDPSKTWPPGGFASFPYEPIEATFSIF